MRYLLFLFLSIPVFSYADDITDAIDTGFSTLWDRILYFFTTNSLYLFALISGMLMLYFVINLIRKYAFH